MSNQQFHTRQDLGPFSIGRPAQEITMIAGTLFRRSWSQQLLPRQSRTGLKNTPAHIGRGNVQLGSWVMYMIAIRDLYLTRLSGSFR